MTKKHKTNFCSKRGRRGARANTNYQETMVKRNTKHTFVLKVDEDWLGAWGPGLIPTSKKLW